MLGSKLTEAKRVISKTIELYKWPIVMCSFGKDSIALSHLVRSMGHNKIPILFHRDPWFAEKYEFADKLIRDWQLTVFDYPPLITSLWHGKGILAFTNHRSE